MKSIELLLDELLDSSLHILDVLVVVIADLTDLGEDPFFKLGAAELGEPFSFGCVFLCLFLQMDARILLLILIFLSLECWLGIVCKFSCLGGRVGASESLQVSLAESSAGGQDFGEERCLSATSFKEHIFY